MFKIDLNILKLNLYYYIDIFSSLVVYDLNV